jgi:enediyne biosynthesis protein E4
MAGSPSPRLYLLRQLWLNRPVIQRFRVCVGTAAALVITGTIAACSGPGAAVPSAAGAAPHFVDDTPASGVDHSYDGGFEFFVGGGAGTFDCDGDGRPDLFLAGGTKPAALYRNLSTVGGALRFERIESPVTDLTSVTGAYPLDIDSDGITDLVVLRRGGNVLLRGLGGCRFATANDRFGLDAGNAWTVAFSATWEAANALPTMAFGNYLVPDTYDCDTSRLVRPAAGGGSYATATVLAPGYCSLSMLFSDWGRTGHRDLRVTNDRHYYTDGAEQLWQVTSGAPPREYTQADGWRRLQVWGMGIASHDITGDGIPEVFLTSQGDNKLQMLDPSATAPAYADIALRRGATVQRPYAGGDVLPSTAWHPEFGDVNNDGIVDLFVTKGNVDGQTDHAMRDPNDLLIGQADGTFKEGAPEAGIVRYDMSRGAAVIDLNLDGQLDLVIVDRQANIQLWRNTGSGDAKRSVPMGHWLAVELKQAAPNVDAIGAWLDVRVGDRTISREVTVGGGHASGELGWLHTGLGTATEADVRVQWPDGEVGPWTRVRANQFVTITRGATAPVPWTPIK